MPPGKLPLRKTAPRDVLHRIFPWGKFSQQNYYTPLRNCLLGKLPHDIATGKLLLVTVLEVNSTSDDTMLSGQDSPFKI